MSSAVLSAFLRISSRFRRPDTRRQVSLSRLRTTSTASIFEQLTREELKTKFKSRLRGRQFLPGASEGGFPEFLAEPRDSFPLGVRVNNSSQSSLAKLTTKCVEFVEKNFSHSPAILFRGLPAKTAENFSIIAQTVQMQFNYDGGTGYRTFINKDSGVTTASEDPYEYTIEPHNEMSYTTRYPSKVSHWHWSGKNATFATYCCVPKRFLPTVKPRTKADKTSALQFVMEDKRLLYKEDN